MWRARPSTLAILVAVAGLTLPACGILYGRPMKVEHASGVTSTGVRWRDQLRGLGPPAEPDSVVLIHYTARLKSGEEVDSTHGRGLPETIDLSEPAILGLADGIVGMRAGGRRAIVVPPHRAFGHVGVEGLVPPDAPLRFEIELIEIHREE